MSSVADLVEKIDHLNHRVARQLISAAKVSVFCCIFLIKIFVLLFHSFANILTILERDNEFLIEAKRNSKMLHYVNFVQ